MIWGAFTIIIILSFILAVALKKPAVALAGIATSVSSFGLHFAIGNLRPHNRMTLSFFMLIAFALVLCYIVFLRISLSKIKFKNLVIFAIVWVVLFQSREMNQIFWLDYQRYRRDVMIMNTIVSDGGILQDKPVIFVGTIPDLLPKREIAGFSIFDFGRGVAQHIELFDWQHYAFFRVHNFPISQPNVEDVDIALLSAQVADMPSWPDDGYIREFEEYIVIRLGSSFLD